VSVTIFSYEFKINHEGAFHNLLDLLLLQGLLPGVLVNLWKIGHVFRLLYLLGRLRYNDSGGVSTEAFNMEDAKLEKKVRLKTTDERQACSSEYLRSKGLQTEPESKNCKNYGEKTRQNKYDVSKSE